MTYRKIRWPSGYATYTHKLVGPAHDPYSRTVITIDVRGHHMVLVDCSLAGLSFRIDGHVFEEHRDGSNVVKMAVLTYTGLPYKFWGDIWHKMDMRAYRRDPEAWMAAVESQRSIYC